MTSSCCAVSRSVKLKLGNEEVNGETGESETEKGDRLRSLGYFHSKQFGAGLLRFVSCANISLLNITIRVNKQIIPRSRDVLCICTDAST